MTKTLTLAVLIVLLTFCGLPHLMAEGLSPDNIASEHHWEVVITPANQSDYGIEVLIKKFETERAVHGRDITILVKEGAKITRLSNATFDKRKDGKILLTVPMAISDCYVQKCIKFLGVDADAVDRETYVILCDSPLKGTTIANYFVISLWEYIHGRTAQDGVDDD